jgi:FG-GAP-like repeat
MPVKFTKKLVAARAFESAAVFDVDGNGVPDIVSGAFWYEGPDFRKWHFMGEVARGGEYFDDFSTIPLDINGDGRLDIITGGWFGQNLRWRENPGDPDKVWPEHLIANTGSVETTRAWDIDGDGIPEIVPNTPRHPLTVYKLIVDAKGRGRGEFVSDCIFDQPQGHGLGFGDINGDGRGEFVLSRGWLEAPDKMPGTTWQFHQEFDLGRDSSIPIIVADVNGDGLNDLIVGNSHSYGLSWWQQGRDSGENRTWTKHPIDPFNSQYHDLHWCDIDGDGANELVTGKRFRAHCGRDPGEFDDLGIYYFKWTGESFAKQVISYGEPGVGIGCGIDFAMADLRGTGRLDIVAPGKDGLYVLFNEGVS